MTGRRVILSRARWGVAVVSAKLRRAVLVTLAYCYPVTLVASMADTSHRVIVAAGDGAPWWELARPGLTPFLVLCVHALWSVHSSERVVVQLQERSPKAELLSPTVAGRHRP